MPRDLVRRWYPDAEVFFLSEAVPFNYPLAELGFELCGHQLSIYTEVWDAKRLRSRKHGNILLNNTYLSSFAYNIAVVWHHFGSEYHLLKSDQQCKLGELLSYNLKKFYSEQIMRRSNCVFGVAIFLETLLYEEHLMVPLFEAGKVDEKSTALYKSFQEAMSSLLLFHEIGHIVRDHRPDMLGLMQTEHSMATLGDYWSGYNSKLRIEFECDAFAVFSAIQQRENLPLQTTLRVIVFAFVFFAVMKSIDTSAEATVAGIPSGSAIEDLDDVFSDMSGSSFVLGVDEFFVARARSVQLIVEKIAEQHGLALYGLEDDFPLVSDMIDVLPHFFLGMITKENPSYRAKCEMLARALRDNPRGLRYLRLRSKKFVMPQRASGAA
jgi:hypothetical protein